MLRLHMPFHLYGTAHGHRIITIFTLELFAVFISKMSFDAIYLLKLLVADMTGVFLHSSPNAVTGKRHQGRDAVIHCVSEEKRHVLMVGVFRGHGIKSGWQWTYVWFKAVKVHNLGW